MRNFIILLMSLFSFAAFAAPETSMFTIDWNDQRTLNQQDALGCEGPNTVILTIPGTYSKDFTVDNGGNTDCRLVSIKKNNKNTQLIYRGSCASDGDETFIIHQRAAPKNEAIISIAAGC